MILFECVVSAAGLVAFDAPARQLHEGGMVPEKLAVVKQLIGLVAALMFVALVLSYSRKSQD